MKVISNFISHEPVKCDERDPSWINAPIKNLINDKNIHYKKYLRRDKYTKEEFKLLQKKIVNLTNDSRDRIYSRKSNKLNNFHVSLKAYWSVLKMVLNNKKNSIIPPSFYENRFYKKGWIT